MIRRAIISLTFVLGAVLGLVPVAMAEGSGLVALKDRGRLLGWEAVGRLDVGGGYCTAVLIAPDLLLTAAHCLFDMEAKQRRDLSKMNFRAGLRDGKSIADVGILRGVAHAGYDPTGSGARGDQIRHDAALLQLKRPIPAQTAAPFALHSGRMTGERVSVVSYAKGRDNAPSWQKDCGVLGMAQGLIAMDCDVTFGASGAPVFAKEQGRARILTLVSAGVNSDDKKIAYGMELPGLVADLKAQLRAMPGGGNTGTLNAGAKRISLGAGGGGAMNRGSGGAKFVRAGGS
ncbi:MAG: trypsin-like serine peptidase [Paracoccaceae bacterium]